MKLAYWKAVWQGIKDLHISSARFAKLGDTTLKLERRILELENELRKRTTIGCDIGFREHQSYAVMIGHLNGKDYVQSFALYGDSFQGIVRQLKEMGRYGEVCRVDSPPQFRSIIEREL